LSGCAFIGMTAKTAYFIALKINKAKFFAKDRKE
jgi:hypothetical protein